MCGIFALLGSNNNSQMNMDIINKAFERGRNRGPEFSKLVTSSNNALILGFHRLAINGLNEESNQPLILNGIELICNGEIYNYKSLYKSMNITPNTGSDCEVIIHLYLKYGIEQTLTMLDGVFAFVLYDKNENLVFASRDPYGVRPLYELNISDNDDIVGFASELKMLEPFYNLNNRISSTKQFEPGTYSIYKYDDDKKWKRTVLNKSYFIPTFPVSEYVFDINEYKNKLY